jgi:hypothetical protein
LRDAGEREERLAASRPRLPGALVAYFVTAV